MYEAEYRHTTLPLTDEEIERANKIAEGLSRRAAGARVSRTGVIRIAVERGLNELERELEKEKK